ncbi:MAG: argininosuccinate synthase [Bacteroidetes bacterium GWF2_49_14]|nr:MAG: argininosuccinate synthase [Bacteroidetes bacterium GWF2_49_14]HBB92440.1 argininosuccinate synthase [Bacteroidales bacterium]
MKNKVVLAYSGGLDTSVILKWLINKGYQVICYVGDVGQGDNYKEVEAKALALGASKVFVEDLRHELVTDYIFPALRGNAMYEGRYLLGTAIARPLIAKRQVEIAKKENCLFLSHGSTGKGNDQVRFEFAYYALYPEAKIISPWKDPEFLREFKGRTDMIRYAKENNIPVKVTVDKSYSEDENLMHISHEAGILENPSERCPEHVYSKSLSPMMAPDKETLIEIEFENGTPVRIKNLEDEVEKTDPLELFEYANHIAGINGVGRIDLVENRFIGIKSRGIYETPGGYLLWAAHRDLEGIAMDKEVMHLRDMLIPKYAELIYNGLWFSPEMDFLLAAFNKSQEQINGTVVVSLYKGNAMPVYRSSPVSLYDQDLSSMDIEGGFDATDSRGFININAIRLKAHYLVLRKKQPYKWRPAFLK